MATLQFLRDEIDHMRRKAIRQRNEIRALERAGIPAKSAEELLERMLAKVDGLCAQRDEKLKEGRVTYTGTDKTIKGPIERRSR
jgi:hypothetical protein